MNTKKSTFESGLIKGDWSSRDLTIGGQLSAPPMWIEGAVGRGKTAALHRAVVLAMGLGAVLQAPDALAELDVVFANLFETNRVCLNDGSGGFSCGDVSSDTNSSLRQKRCWTLEAARAGRNRKRGSAFLKTEDSPPSSVFRKADHPSCIRLRTALTGAFSHPRQKRGYGVLYGPPRIAGKNSFVTKEILLPYIRPSVSAQFVAYSFDSLCLDNRFT